MTNEEKMQQLKELMGDFLDTVATRASQGQQVSTSSVPESVEPEINDNHSSYEQDDNDYDSYEDEDESSYTDNAFLYDEEDTDVGVPQFNAEEFKKSLLDSMMQMKTFYDNERYKKSIEHERKSSSAPKQCDEVVLYKKNTATFNGRPFEYKVLQKEANWGTAFTQSFSMDDKITNLDKLNEKIVEDIKLNFGDLSRITEVAVVSGMLILNGVQYYPLCRDKEFLNGLPFDCADYFKSGLIAEIFDFGYLYYMPYLTSLKIDSVDFAVRKFAYDIGLRNFKVQSVFKAFKNLKYFELADTFFEAPGKDTNANVEEAIERQSRAEEIYNNYIINNASAFSNWSFNNLKSYACNRGDKGLFKYTGGVLVRGIISAGAGVGELGLRTIGAAVKGGVSLLKKAFSDNV